MLPSSNFTDSKIPSRRTGLKDSIRRSIDRLVGGFILGMATAVGYIVKRNAEYNEQRGKDTDHRPCESRNYLAAPGERSSPRAANSLQREKRL
jgi:hypothetical protein